jgi:hypothetical protein
MHLIFFISNAQILFIISYITITKKDTHIIKAVCVFPLSNSLQHPLFYCIINFILKVVFDLQNRAHRPLPHDFANAHCLVSEFHHIQSPYCL